MPKNTLPARRDARRAGTTQTPRRAKLQLVGATGGPRPEPRPMTRKRLLACAGAATATFGAAALLMPLSPTLAWTLLFTAFAVAVALAFPAR